MKSKANLSEDDKETYELAIGYVESIIVSVTNLKNIITELKDGTVEDYGMLRVIWCVTNTFQHVFEWQISGRTSHPAQEAQLSIRSLQPRELKRRVLAMAMEWAMLGIGLEKGRRPGSKNEQLWVDIQKKIEGREKIILSTVRDVHKKAIRKYGEFEAEDEITKKAVAKELGISRTTLDNWLKQSGLNFRDLVDRTLRTAERVQRK